MSWVTSHVAAGLLIGTSVLFVALSPARAQPNPKPDPKIVDFRVGVVNTGFWGEAVEPELSDDIARWGGAYGLRMEIPLKGPFALGVGANYVNKGAETDLEFLSTEQMVPNKHWVDAVLLDYLEMSVLGSVSTQFVPFRFRFFAGPTVAWNTSAEVEISHVPVPLPPDPHPMWGLVVDPEEVVKDVSDQFRTVEAGLSIGAGFDLGTGLDQGVGLVVSAEARYHIGLSGIGHSPSARQARNKGLEFALAIGPAF